MLSLNAADTLQAQASAATALTVTVFGVEVVSATGVETFKRLAQSQPGVTPGTLYTVPAGTETLIRSITVANPTGTARTIEFWIAGSAAANQLLPPISVDAGGYAVYNSDSWKFYTIDGASKVSYAPVGASTLTGTVLASNVVTSSLTSFGTLAANLLFTDATYDIGQSGATRPRHLYASGNGVFGGTLAATGTVQTNGTYVIVRDITAYSAGVTGGAFLLQGLDSSGVNSNLFVFQSYAKASQQADGVFKIAIPASTEVARFVGGASAALTVFKLSCIFQLANAYVATPVTSAGYVTMQDSTGATIKVMVGT